MKKLIFAALLFILGLNVSAQQTVVLQSNGSATIFSDLNPFVEAYQAASNGDTLYLSGGGFIVPDLIDKGLVVFGAGFYPDSTTATYPTFFSNPNFRLGENADNLHLEGIEMQRVYKSSNVNLDNLTLIRCKIYLINFSFDGTPTVYSSNNSIVQCVIDNVVDMSGVINSSISNSILGNSLDYSTNNTIQNNIFLHNPSAAEYVMKSVIGNTFINNVFNSAENNLVSSSTGNIFESNIFGSLLPYLGEVAVDISNFKGIDISTIFVDQSGNVFDYSQNYHLQTDALVNYPGKDGAEVGIFGGILPFKEGAVPQNPHISFKSIAPATDSDGMLKVEIRVSAQQD